MKPAPSPATEAFDRLLEALEAEAARTALVALNLALESLALGEAGRAPAQAAVRALEACASTERDAALALPRKGAPAARAESGEPVKPRKRRAAAARRKARAADSLA